MDGIGQDRPDYIARARSRGPAIAAAADEVEKGRELPRSLVSTLTSAGFSASCSRANSAAAS